MRKIFLILFAASVSFAQTNVQSNCNQLNVSLTSAIPGPSYQNTGQVKCTGWRVSIFDGPAVTQATWQLEISPDNNGAPGPWLIIGDTQFLLGTNPETITSQFAAQQIFTAYGPWIRLNLTTLTCTGFVGCYFNYNLTGSANIPPMTPTPFVPIGSPTPLPVTIDLVGAGNGITTSALQGITALTLNQQPENVTGSGPMALMVEKGPRWFGFNVSTNGTAAAFVQPAGGAGVRHVADCITWSFNSGATATAAGLNQIRILDGATILWTFQFAIPATTNTSSSPGGFSQCGLQLMGTANTTMTATFSAGIANSNEVLDISGYDVQ